MNTSLKTSPKKRKSLAKQGETPAKISKVENGTPKTKTPAKTPLISNTPKKTPKQKEGNLNKTPKMKQDNEAESGEGTNKLKKFEGANSLEKKTKKKEGKKKALSKKQFLVQRLKEESKSKGKEAVIKSLNEKIDQISSRDSVTKTAKRKLKTYKLMIESILGNVATKPSSQKTNGAKPDQGKKNKIKVEAAAKSADKKAKTTPKVLSQSPDDEENEEGSSDSDNLVEGNVQNAKKAKIDAEADDQESEEDSDESGDEEESDDDKEVTGEDKNKSGSEEEDSDEEGDESDDEGDDSEEGNEDKPEKVQSKSPQQTSPEGKKSRYVLFVGNLAYETTKEELEEHFSRAGEVADVRIPTEKETNRPRGFAYVEYTNEASYQKALDLNGSQLKNRRLKVEYTQGGNKNSEDQKRDIKAKNFKLHAMRKEGQFGGAGRGRGGGGGRGRGGFGGRGGSPGRGRGGFRGRNRN